MALLLLASAALFTAGVASPALQLRCALAPDMLRYVASMTYANPHFSTPPGGSALDKMARVHLLCRVRVHLLRRVHVHVGDVGGARSVGEVAFVAAAEVETRDLEQTRFYV